MRIVVCHARQANGVIRLCGHAESLASDCKSRASGFAICCFLFMAAPLSNRAVSLTDKLLQLERKNKAPVQSTQRFKENLDCCISAAACPPHEGRVITRYRSSRPKTPQAILQTIETALGYSSKNLTAIAVRKPSIARLAGFAAGFRVHFVNAIGQRDFLH